MTVDNISEVDARIVSGLTGAEKLKVLIRQRSGTLADWARENSVDEVELHHTLAGRREYPEHREKIAATLQLRRSEVDALIARDGK